MKSFIQYLEEKVIDPRIMQFAAKVHENWRKTGIPENERNMKRERSKNGGPLADINVPFDKLHPTAQQENIAAGHAALAAIKKHPNNPSAAAAHVHKKWMERNPITKDNAAQHVPYEQLPKHEQQKDIDHVDIMSSLKK